MTRFPVLLDAEGNEERRITPISMNITEKITPLSTAVMVVPKEQTIPNRSYVKVFAPGRFCGIYRSRIPEGAYGNRTETSITMEHGICEVGDFVITHAIQESVLPFSSAISLVFSHYRGNKWQIGRIDATEDVVCNISVSNVLQAMLSLMNQIPQYMMAFDFDTTPWTINIVRLPSEVSAEGRLSRNVNSARVRNDDSTLFTRAYLAGLPTEEGEDIGHLDADTISIYGVIETVLNANDYTEEEAILVATNYLERHKKPIVSVQIDGVDFSDVTGEPLDRVELGKLYRFAVKDNVIEEHVTSIQWRNVYSEKDTVSIQLSEEQETALKIIHEQGVNQTNSSTLQNKRESEYKDDTARRTATGAISIDAESFTGEQEFTITFSLRMPTVNYAVFLTPDNESENEQIALSGLAYGVYAKTRNGFNVLVKIPSASLPEQGTVLLRWFAIAK